MDRCNADSVINKEYSRVFSSSSEEVRRFDGRISEEELARRTLA